MRSALPASLVAGVVEARELDDARRAEGQLPDGLLAVEAVLVADDFFEPLDHALGLGLLAPHDQRTLVFGQDQASQQVSLAAAGRAPVAGDVGLALVGKALWTGQRHPRATSLQLSGESQGAVQLFAHPNTWGVWHA